LSAILAAARFRAVSARITTHAMLARIAEQRSEGIPRGEISPAARQPNFF